MSRRHTNAVAGFVNFPVESPEYKNSGEGGMFVRLVVIDHTNYDDKWAPCCGGNVHVVYDEVLVRDDQREPAPFPKADASPDELDLETLFGRKYEQFHFPQINSDNPSVHDFYERLLSRGYLAAILIGATGWSGYSEEKHAYWHCTYDDLTAEGRALYIQLQALYPGRTIYLQTWLDT